MSDRIFIYGMNYSPEFVGVGRYTGELAEHLAASGSDVTVVTTPPHYPEWSKRAGYPPGWSKSTERNVRVYRCPLYLPRRMRGIWRLIAPLSFAITSAPVAMQRIFADRPDVVVVVEPTLLAAPAAVLAAKLVGARVIMHVQDLEVDAAFAVGHLPQWSILKKAAEWLERQALRPADEIVTISPRMAARLSRKLGSERDIQVVRNWVDLTAIQPLDRPSSYREELGFASTDFIVMYSGTLGHKQGLRLLIKAAEELAPEAGIVFVVAGNGPLRLEIEKASANLPNLRLLPFQPEARMGEFLGLADAHVLLQEAEAADLLLPSKLGGMLASGRPIIVTSTAGTELADFLGDTCAFSPPGDVTALAAAVREAWTAADQPDQRAGRLSRAAVLSKEAAMTTFGELITKSSKRSSRADRRRALTEAN